jgi:hypothetical protein
MALSYFIQCHRNARMGVMIYNARRMQAVQNSRLDDESNPATERRYSLSVAIAAEGEDPQ